MPFGRRSWRRAAVVLTAVTALAVPLTGAAPGVEGPAPVRVSEDGRWFTVDGEPFFWLADTRPDLFSGLDRAEVERYLDERAAQGFTVVQAPVRDDVLVTPGVDPRMPDGYDYWDHVDFVVAAAARRDLRIAMEPGRPTADGPGTLGYGGFLGERYGDDVLWVLEQAGCSGRLLAAGIAVGTHGSERYTDLLLTYRRAGSAELDVLSDGMVGESPFVGATSVSGAPIELRRMAYGAVFDGAAGITHTQPGGVVELGHLRDLMTSRPYLSRVPDRGLLTAGAVGDGARATRDAGGSYLMAYSPGGQEFAVDTSALTGAALRGWWFDPRSGSVIDMGSVARGEAVFVFPPQTGEADAGLDWVLVVDDVAAGFGPPGATP